MLNASAQIATIDAAQCRSTMGHAIRADSEGNSQRRIRSTRLDGCPSVGPVSEILFIGHVTSAKVNISARRILGPAPWPRRAWTPRLGDGVAAVLSERASATAQTAQRASQGRFGAAGEWTVRTPPESCGGGTKALDCFRLLHGRSRRHGAPDRGTGPTASVIGLDPLWDQLLGATMTQTPSRANPSRESELHA